MRKALTIISFAGWFIATIACKASSGAKSSPQSVAEFVGACMQAAQVNGNASGNPNASSICEEFYGSNPISKQGQCSGANRANDGTVSIRALWQTTACSRQSVAYACRFPVGNEFSYRFIYQSGRNAMAGVSCAGGESVNPTAIAVPEPVGGGVNSTGVPAADNRPVVDDPNVRGIAELRGFVFVGADTSPTPPFKCEEHFAAPDRSAVERSILASGSSPNPTLLDETRCKRPPSAHACLVFTLETSGSGKINSLRPASLKFDYSASPNWKVSCPQGSGSGGSSRWQVVPIQ